MNLKITFRICIIIASVYVLINQTANMINNPDEPDMVLNNAIYIIFFVYYIFFYFNAYFMRAWAIVGIFITLVLHAYYIKYIFHDILFSQYEKVSILYYMVPELLFPLIIVLVFLIHKGIKCYAP